MNLGNLIKDAGFNVNTRRADATLPFLPEDNFNAYLAGKSVCVKEVLEKYAEDFDVQDFKDRVHPYMYDKLYAWILRNGVYCKKITASIVEVKEIRKVKSQFSGRSIVRKVYDTPLSDSILFTNESSPFNYLAFYLSWNNEEDCMELKVPNKHGKWVKELEENLEKSFNFDTLEGVIEFLECVKDRSRYIPVELDKLCAPSISYSSGSYRVSMKGARILKAAEVQPILKEALKNTRINPAGYYFITKRYNSDTDSDYVTFRRDWTKEPNGKPNYNKK